MPVNLTPELVATLRPLVEERIKNNYTEIEQLNRFLNGKVPRVNGHTPAKIGRPRKSAQDALEAVSGTKPLRKRKPMSAAERKAASKRMKAYWAAQRAGQ